MNVNPNRAFRYVCDSEDGASSARFASAPDYSSGDRVAITSLQTKACSGLRRLQAPCKSDSSEL